MTRRALITGAQGFVGQHLMSHLADRGWEVLGTDRDVSTSSTPFAQTCDISDPTQIDSLLQWAAPLTHVFHLAAITFVPEADHDPSGTFAVNLQGTVHLASALRRHAPAARFLYVGSSEVYGHPQFLPMTEDHPFNPTNPYAISKAAADQYCAYLHHAGLLDVVRMRPFNHSGAGQSDRFVLSSFARQIANIETSGLSGVLHVGNLEAQRDFSHVTDVVRAYEKAALDGKSGEAYNVCSGKSVSIRDALDKLLLLSDANITVQPDPERLRPVDVPEVRGNCDRLSVATGWKPEKTLDDILADLMAYWRQQETA